MILQYSNNAVTINSSGPVLKSEDGHEFSFLFNGGTHIDKDICSSEPANFYFYSGDGVIQTVACKTS